MNNSAAGEMNTQVQGGEEYKLFGRLGLSHDFNRSAGEISVSPFPGAIYLEMEIRIPIFYFYFLIGVAYQEAKWMCVISTHSHGEGPALHLLS